MARPCNTPKAKTRRANGSAEYYLGHSEVAVFVFTGLPGFVDAVAKMDKGVAQCSDDMAGYPPTRIPFPFDLITWLAILIFGRSIFTMKLFRQLAPGVVPLQVLCLILTQQAYSQRYDGQYWRKFEF